MYYGASEQVIQQLFFEQIRRLSAGFSEPKMRLRLQTYNATPGLVSGMLRLVRHNILRR